MGSLFDASWIVTVVDVLIVAFLIYRGMLLIRGTRAAPMLGGLALLVGLYFLANPLGLVTVSWILGNILSSLLLLVVVLFQDEIRRGLTKVGLQPFMRLASIGMTDKTIEDLTVAASKLAKMRLGAIIVLQREVGLEEFLEGGTILDAQLSRKLLVSLFLKESPLHDGAVILDRDRVRAAGCVLPLSFNPDLDPQLGTRHRAALGLSERCDAIIIVVSEETGSITLVREGRMTRNLDASMLRDALHRLIVTQEEPDALADGV